MQHAQQPAVNRTTDHPAADHPPETTADTPVTEHPSIGASLFNLFGLGGHSQPSTSQPSTTETPSADYPGNSGSSPEERQRYRTGVSASASLFGGGGNNSRVWMYDTNQGWRSYSGSSMPPPVDPSNPSGPPNDPSLNIARLLSQLVSPHPHAPPQQDGHPVDPIAALLSSLGVLNGHPGDYVHDQRTLDDLLTQLMDQTRGGVAGMTDQQVDQLDLVEIFPPMEGEEHLDCAICQEEFFDPKDPSRKPVFARKLVCDHKFHDECIRPWLTRNGTCPVCRMNVLEPRQEPLD